MSLRYVRPDHPLYLHTDISDGPLRITFVTHQSGVRIDTSNDWEHGMSFNGSVSFLAGARRTYTLEDPDECIIESAKPEAVLDRLGHSHDGALAKRMIADLEKQLARVTAERDTAQEAFELSKDLWRSKRYGHLRHIGPGQVKDLHERDWQYETDWDDWEDVA